MTRRERINNEVLQEAGLALMRENGKTLSKAPSPGRSMLYTMPNGDSVRVRTSNDHRLIVLADKPTEDAELNIEGTDWLLIVMPEVERTGGNVVAYLVPTKEAVEAVRERHQDWLCSNPRTSGENTTWVLPFNRFYSGSVAEEGKYDYAQNWAKYRLEGEVSTEDKEKLLGSFNKEEGIKAEVEAARHRVARAASVSPQAVKISIEFGG